MVEEAFGSFEEAEALFLAFGAGVEEGEGGGFGELGAF